MKGEKIRSDRVRELMRKHSLNQTELAETIGVTRANISRILKSEESHVRKRTLEDLSEFFECSEEYLQGKVDKADEIIKIVNGEEMVLRRLISFDRNHILSEKVSNLAKRNLELAELIVDSLEQLNTNELDIVKAFFKALPKRMYKNPFYEAFWDAMNGGGLAEFDCYVHDISVPSKLNQLKKRANKEFLKDKRRSDEIDYFIDLIEKDYLGKLLDYLKEATEKAISNAAYAYFDTPPKKIKKNFCDKASVNLSSENAKKNL